VTDSISIDKLALSSTFAICDGKLLPRERKGSVFNDGESLPAGFVVGGKYRIVKLIGSGGMGCVYQVHHEQLDKVMALKTIATQDLAAESWQRFQREARAISKLRHRSIVEVFDFGIESNGLPYYTMELLQGESLAEILARKGPFDTAYAIRLFLQVGEALGHAHSLKILHRDIKQANIFITSSFGQSGIPLVKIVDFGLAKLASEEDQYLTNAGCIFGSPLYMSPEQSMAEPADHRSDIYSFACSLFHAITGSPPFVGDTAFITLLNHQQCERPTLTSVNPRCSSSQRLESVMKKMLSKRPENRFDNFDQVCTELQACIGALETIKSFTVSSAEIFALKDISVNTDQRLELRPKWLIPLVVLFLMTLLVGVGYCVWQQSPKKANRPSGDLSQKQGSSKYHTSDDLSIEGDKVFKPAPAYFTELRQNGPKGLQKIMFFPEEENHAEIESNMTGLKQKCFGKMTFPARADLNLTCYDNCDPAFLRRFRPDDLVSLKLAATANGEWSEAHLKAICNLSGLRILDLSDSEFDGNAVNELNKLTHLIRLNVTNTKITGLDLLKLSLLKNIETLEVSNTKNCVELVEQYPRNSHLRGLFASNSGLTDEAMAYLARQKRLEVLSLQNNLLSVKGLKSIETLTALRYLDVSGMDIGPQAIESLVHFPYLSKLVITRSYWTEKQVERLKKALPVCRFRPDSRGGIDAE